MGDNEKNVEKEKLNLQSINLLNNETKRKLDIQSCKPQEERKARKLRKMKITITVAVCAMVLLILVSIIVDITKKCTAIENGTECGTPPNVNHGSYSKIGNIPGSASVLNCTEGYIGIGENEIFCQNDGQWSKTTFVCMKDCHKPPNVMNSTNIEVGVRASYRCNDGFYPVGDTTIECKDGNWSSIKFSCFKYCGLPPDIPFSAHEIHGNISGAKTAYNCLSGYVPVGEPNIVCNSNGEWSPVKLSCLKDCPKPPNIISSTYWKSANKSGVFTSYRCDPGFYIVGEQSIICKDGVWSTVKFSCSKYCGSPPVVPYGTSSKGGNTSGAITSYQCISGYIPVGDRNIFCESSGEWSTPDISCLKDCGKPPSISFAEVFYETTYTGSKAIYSCNSGFTHVGYPTATCIRNGNWFMSNFYCKPPETSSKANVVILSPRSWIFTFVVGTMVKMLFVHI